MNRRHRDILNLILNAEGYITGSELARICNVTVRTIRSDILKINEVIKDYNAEISSSAKKGYFLTDKNKDILILNNVIRKIIDSRYIDEIPSIPSERQKYILLQLIKKQYIFMEELSEKLYVSAATINGDISVINKYLKNNFKVIISCSFDKGYTLKTSEKEKRNIISWVLSEKMNISTIAKIWNDLFEENLDFQNEVRKAYEIIDSTAKKYNYYLSGHSCQLFCYEVLGADLRIKEGFAIENNNKEKLLQVISEMKTKFKDELEINLNDHEWNSLQQYFVSRQFIDKTDIRNFNTKKASQIIEEFFYIVLKKYNINLISDDNRYKLILYICPMINRLENNYCIPNRINEGIIKSYKMEYKIAEEMKNIIKSRLNLNVSKTDIVYIMLHLISMCSFHNYKYNTIIVCDYDESVICFIKNMLQNQFGHKINLTGFYGYNQFKYEDKNNLKNIDIIITTSTIADITDIPFVRIKPETDKNDIEMISRAIDNLKIK